MYALIKVVTKAIIPIKFQIEVSGLQLIPEKGPVIIAANHVSNYDPIILGSLIKRKIHFLAKKELFSNHFSHWFFSNLNAIPVNRYHGTVIQPVRHSLLIIKNGEALGIFPEGKRCKNGEKVTPKKGVAFFAVKTGAPIIPVALSGVKKGLCQPVKVIFGSPIHLLENETIDYLNIAQMVMDRIRGLMVEMDSKV